MTDVYITENDEADNQAFLVAFLFPVELVEVLGATFFGGALLVALLVAAALALAGAPDPVTAFLAVPRLEGAVVFFTGADFFPAKVFFGAGVAFALAAAGALVAALAVGTLVADFLVVVGLVAVDLEAMVVVRDLAVDFLGATALAVEALVVAVLAGLALTAAALGAALGAGLFSLEAEASAPLLVLGGNFTRPEMPLGKLKMPFSKPVAMALLS